MMVDPMLPAFVQIPNRGAERPDSTPRSSGRGPKLPGSQAGALRGDRTMAQVLRHQAYAAERRPL